MFFIVVNKYKIWYWIKYDTYIIQLKQLKHEYVTDTTRLHEPPGGKTETKTKRPTNYKEYEQPKETQR